MLTLFVLGLVAGIPLGCAVAVWWVVLSSK